MTDLLWLYSGPNNSSVTSLCEKMLDLGAQLSPLSGDNIGRGIKMAYSLAGEFARCGDIAEGMVIYLEISVCSLTELSGGLQRCLSSCAREVGTSASSSD